jgi:hypothetical protein
LFFFFIEKADVKALKGDAPAKEAAAPKAKKAA